MKRKTEEIIYKIKLFFKILSLSVKNFIKNQGFLISNGLTLKTLFALIPGLLFTVGIINVILPFYQYKENLLKLLKEYLLPVSYEVISGWINQLLETNKTISFLSAIIFIFLSIDLLITLDKHIQRIWVLNLKKPKIDKILRYWALFSGIPFVLGGYFYYSGLIKSLLDYSPLGTNIFLNEIFHIVISASLMGLFIFLVNFIIPDTKVQLSKAVIISLATTLIWFFLRVILTYFIPIIIGRWSRIYGYFAILIFFIFWTSANWSFLLLGTEFLSIWQNKLYKTKINYNHMYLFDFAFIVLLLKNFYHDFLNNGKGLSIYEISHKFGCHIIEVQEIINNLEKEDIIISNNKRHVRYFLKKNIELIKLSDVEKIIFNRLKINDYYTLKNVSEISRKILNDCFRTNKFRDLNIKKLIFEEK
ncbi:MAG: YihY/virulence factor BrkB family protein [Spirochaetes bacterium]|nr:YihY/virulence factor BrkB family protein [Spirochaetota bacterium]